MNYMLNSLIIISETTKLNSNTYKINLYIKYKNNKKYERSKKIILVKNYVKKINEIKENQLKIKKILTEKYKKVSNIKMLK